MLPNLLKRGAMANDASRHASCMTGSDAPGMDDPFGSRMMAKRATPEEYVASNEQKSETSVKDENSSRLATFNVRSSEFNREYANFSGLASKDVLFTNLCRNASGLSLRTPPFGPATVLNLDLKCSTSFFMNVIKCSALRMFPGTASLKTSGSKTA
jgi:hypothetical protein